MPPGAVELLQGIRGNGQYDEDDNTGRTDLINKGTRTVDPRSNLENTVAHILD